MAKENSSVNGTLGLGDLGVIRNILMGEQVTKIDASLSDQNAQIAVLRGQLADQEMALKLIIGHLDAKVQARLDELEQRVTQLNDSQAHNLRATITDERKSLSDMLRSVSEQLLQK